MVSGNTSALEHKWEFDILSAELTTLYLEAHHTANSEGDDFIFAYSTDDVNYTDMVTVVKTSDDDSIQWFALPSGLSGTVYIRVRDADRTDNNNELNSISIDNLFIVSEESLENVVLPANGGVLESFTSEYDSNSGVAKLTDGVTNDDGWGSAANPMTQEFVYSFSGGQSATLIEAVLYAGTSVGSYFSKDVEVWTSTDGITYTLGGSGTLVDDFSSILTLDLGGVLAKKVKLVITSGYSSDYWDLGEFVVNGVIN